MKRSLVTLCGSGLALLLLAAAAHASPMIPDSISITENWAPSGPGFVVVGNESRVYAQSGNPNDHYISFSNESAVALDVPSQTSSLPPVDILATNLKVVTSATKASPDIVDTDYTLSVLLTDNTNNASGSAQFKGHLHAIFYHTATGDFSSMKNTWAFDPTQPQPVDINGNTVFVQIDQFTHSSTSGSQNNGSIGGEIWATISGGEQPPPHDSPEPATLLLGFLGLSGLGAASCRKWLAARKV